MKWKFQWKNNLACSARWSQGDCKNYNMGKGLDVELMKRRLAISRGSTLHHCDIIVVLWIQLEAYREKQWLQKADGRGPAILQANEDCSTEREKGMETFG